jgi:hypothetical protein
MLMYKRTSRDDFLIFLSSAEKLCSLEKLVFTKDSTQRLICEFSQQSRNKEGSFI